MVSPRKSIVNETQADKCLAKFGFISQELELNSLKEQNSSCQTMLNVDEWKLNKTFTFFILGPLCVQLKHTPSTQEHLH